MSFGRRDFLKVSAAAGGGLALGLALPAGAQRAGGEINAWVLVQANESIVIRYARSEMGQGSMTAAAQLVAEELDCDWSRVRVDYVDTNPQVRRNRAWGDMASTASGTIRHSQAYLRQAGAAARHLLVAAAAQSWEVPAAECRVAAGIIRHERSGRRTSFGRVAAAAAQLELPGEVALKDPADWKIIGKRVPRVDIPDIVAGRMRFSIDTRLPGLAYAAIAQCPVFGGKLKSMDASAIEGRRGVLKVLALGDFVAVVADNWWRASEALRALPLVWEANQALSSETILGSLREGIEAGPVVVARSEGEAVAVLGYVERVVEAEYYAPLLAHLTLEPQSCTAVVKDGQVDVWTSTQDAEATHAVAAAVAGVSPENVYVHRTQAGGAFGRRVTQDFTRRGVAVAAAMGGIPVATLWSREEDVQHDRYRPASLIRLRAGLDESGYPAAWSARVAALAIPGVESNAVAALADQPYAIPHVLVEHASRPAPLPVGFWRGMAHSQNPFARECFLDELAAAAGIDPLGYRLALLGDDSGEKRILQATIHAANKPPRGAHRGIAVSEAFGSYVAAVAEITLKEKLVTVRRLVIGIDPGHAVNPDSVVAQMQGSAAFMLSALFWGEITLKDGRVEQSNLHDQRLLRLSEMPPVEVVIAASGGFWGGVGEPAVAVVGPAIANAMFAATGTPVRSLPLGKAGFELA